MNSVLVDTSYCIRLLKADDPLHQNAMDYFEYFLENNIEMYLSTIVVAEYSVKDNPDNLLALNAFKLIGFDYHDAKKAGEFHGIIKSNKKNQENIERNVIINDCKLIAQLVNRNIDAYISKDNQSVSSIINPIKQSTGSKFEFISLDISLKNYLGRLF